MRGEERDTINIYIHVECEHITPNDIFWKILKIAAQ